MVAVRRGGTTLPLATAFAVCPSIFLGVIKLDDNGYAGDDKIVDWNTVVL
ncbi:MAG: hypothetical protein QW429_05520 [Thermoprotei archaeon]